MKLETMVYKKDNKVGRLTLSRPEALNAISPQLLADLQKVMDEVEGDQEVKALVITGEGRAFSAGADLKHVLGFFDSPAAFAEYLKNFNGVMLRLEELPVVTLALANPSTGFELIADGQSRLAVPGIVISIETQFVSSPQPSALERASPPCPCGGAGDFPGFTSVRSRTGRQAAAGRGVSLALLGARRADPLSRRGRRALAGLWQACASG